MTPKRTHVDGPLSLDRLVQTMPPHEEVGFVMKLTHGGETYEVPMGTYNGARLVVALCAGLRISPPPDLIDLSLEMAKGVVSVS